MSRGARKRIAIRRYVRGLGPELRRRYGRAKRYIPAQVKRTIDAYHRAAGESCDYTAMRAEVAARFLEGARSFDAADVIECGIGWSAGEGASDGGGHAGDGAGDE